MKSISSRLILTFSMLMLVLFIVVTATGLLLSKNGMTELSNTTLTSKLKGDVHAFRSFVSEEYGSLAFIDGNLVDENGQLIAGNYDLVDRTYQELGDAATIFAVEGDDFVRVITNIVKEDGQRAVGTYLGKDSAAYKDVMSGTIFYGSAQILGVDYITAYDPIMDESGQVIGILFVGVEMQEANAIVNEELIVFAKYFVGLVVVALLLGITVSYLMSRSIINPIKASHTFANQLSSGDLTAEIDPKYAADKD